MPRFSTAKRPLCIYKYAACCCSTLPPCLRVTHTTRSVLWQRGRLPQIPSGAEKLAKVPFNLGRPFWVDDPDLNVDRHLHRVLLEPPGDERSLANVVGDIASWPLRRDLPLWELWVIEGLADGRVAILVKMHHSTIDGVSGASMMGHLLDLEPAPQTASQSPDKWQAQEPPKFVRAPWSQRGCSVWRSTGTCPAGAGDRLPPGYHLVAIGAARKQGLHIQAIHRAAHLFNATITARRSVAFTDVALADVKVVKDGFGVTVNDVVTAVVGVAFATISMIAANYPSRTLLGRGSGVRPRSDGRAGGYDEGLGYVLDPGHR